MGGSATIIYGSLDEGFRLKPERRGLLAKVFKGSHNAKVTDKCHELCREVFQKFLDEQFTEPDKNDSMTLAYITERKFEMMSLYLHTEESGEERTYLQVTFSGCAGMAEITSEVATHWFQIGYERSFGEELRNRLLTEAGFTVNEIENDLREFKVGECAGKTFYVIDDPEYGISTDAYLEEEGDFELSEVKPGSDCQCSLCVK